MASGRLVAAVAVVAVLTEHVAAWSQVGKADHHGGQQWIESL